MSKPEDTPEVRIVEEPLSEEQQDDISGGINPQPLPPIVRAPQ